MFFFFLLLHIGLSGNFLQCCLPWPGASGHFTWAARCQSHRACWTHSWIGRFLISSPDGSGAGSFSSGFLSPETRAHSFGRKVEKVEKGEADARCDYILPPPPLNRPTLRLGRSLESGWGAVYLIPVSLRLCSLGQRHLTLLCLLSYTTK